LKGVDESPVQWQILGGIPSPKIAKFFVNLCKWICLSHEKEIKHAALFTFLKDQKQYI
jgi:hypothetical protein